MKYTKTILLVIFWQLSFSQNTIAVYQRACDTCGFGYTHTVQIANPDLPKIDTIQCIMLACDIGTDGIVFWMKGYEIRQGFITCCRGVYEDAYYTLYEHVAFLDSKKKLIPDNVIIWLSK